MEETLLDSLEKSDPPSCVELTYQYRMNEEIMRLSNKLIYNDKLCCGNNQIQTNTISQHCDETVSAASFGLYEIVSLLVQYTCMCIPNCY